MKTRFNLKSLWLAVGLLLLGVVQVNAQTPPYTYMVFQTDFSMLPTVTSNSSVTEGTGAAAGYSWIRTNINQDVPAWTYIDGSNANLQAQVIGTSTSTSYIQLPPIIFNQGGLVTIEFGSGSNRTYTLTDNTGSATGITSDGNAQVANNAAFPRSKVLKATFTLSAANFDGSKQIRINFPGGSDSRLFRVTVWTQQSCADATASFAQSTVNKVAGDAAFTNIFTTNNTSPQVFSSSDESVATVNVSGLVTILGAGTTTIKVTQIADGTRCAVERTYTLNVAAAPCFGTVLGTATNLQTSAAAIDGFTAAWAAVPNASSYTVRIYQGGTLVKPVPNAVSPLEITGLTTNTAYTFTVQAIGNGTTTCNGVESANSSGITTLNPPPSGSPCGSSMITLYKTDFSDWTEINNPNTSGNPVVVGNDGGAGFTITTDAGVYPNGTPPMLKYNSTSARQFITKAFNFVNGATVIIKGNNTTSSGMTNISGATVTDFNTGAAVNFNGIRGAYHVVITYPASLNGLQTLTFPGMRGEIYEIIVCTNPGPDCQLSTFPMPNSTITFNAEIGGNTNVGFVELKGFNLTGDVDVSITGTGAGRFSIASSTIPRNTAMGGILIPVTYTSSVLVGTQDAVITFSTAGCATPVSVNLKGSSTPVGGGCAITTPIETMMFASRIISESSQTLVISGVNLTGDVMLSIGGANAVQFSVSESTVPMAQANGAGKAVTITYLGGFQAGTHAATLTITSGSCTAVVPLVGRTTNFEPQMWTLTTIAVPEAGGTITRDIAGPAYPSGTVVRVQAIAETGYRFVRWSDVANYSPTRNITMTGNITITAIFAPSDTGGTLGDLEAYNITGVTATGFTANWRLISGAAAGTLYTVKVYEQNENGLPGALVFTSTPTTGTSTNVSGLTTGKAYFYQVEANTALGDTSEMLGSYPVGALQQIVCGAE